ncbi:hypothetical protein [Streptomyces tropicalis]|uniref:Uncharacterized protein n=1 Tax=Streptomyces tropicalis TaxID=3034234 RepID=A0ABT6AES3_9ACTN|nr:hypothetical protein [Streptomyces tropicalis]MDF3302932.1 hypothetical protein [Streptomyces tropicalis]
MTSRPARGEAALDAEITLFGEALAAYDFVPKPEHGEALLIVYASALDAYEAAKRVLAAARTADEADVAVRQALAEGHRALADLDALRDGRPVRRSPPSCFFDTRHGPSVTEILWAPPGGEARTIPVCVADAVRLEDGNQRIAAERVWHGQQPERTRATEQKRGAGPYEPGGRKIRDWATRAEPADRPAQSGVVRLKSPGPQDIGLYWNPAAPAVLVVRAVSYGKHLSTTLQKARPGSGSASADVLLKASGDFTARLPMAGGGKKRPRLRISNTAVAGAPFDPRDFDANRIPYWDAWMELPGSCREFTTSISGDGWDVVRYTGGRATARLTHDGRRGEVVVKRLNSDFQTVEQLFRGYRSVAEGELFMPAKPAWLAVHCQGTWTLTTSPDRSANA